MVHETEREKHMRILCETMTVTHNNVMDLDNVMQHIRVIDKIL